MDADSKNNLPDITHLIRSIQRIEGNPDCFRKADGNCNRTDCFWLEYCLKKTQKDWKGTGGINDWRVMMLSEKNIFHAVNISDRSFIRMGFTGDLLI